MCFFGELDISWETFVSAVILCQNVMRNLVLEDKHVTYIANALSIYKIRRFCIIFVFFAQGELDHETEVTACDLHLDDGTSQMTVVTGTKQGMYDTFV